MTILNLIKAGGRHIGKDEAPALATSGRLLAMPHRTTGSDLYADLRYLTNMIVYWNGRIAAIRNIVSQTRRNEAKLVTGKMPIVFVARCEIRSLLSRDIGLPACSV